MGVLTVRGLVPDSEIRMFNSHIHLVAHPPAWLYKTPSFENDPDYFLTDWERGLEELRHLIDSGGKGALDATTRDYGRSPAALKYIVDRAPGFHLVAVTGFNRGIYLDDSYYNTPLDRLADFFASEVSEGMEGTGLKAGVIKVGADYMRMLPIEEKCMKAAAIAHKATGAPIVVHITLGTFAAEIQAFLEREGVDPGSVVFFHADRNLDPWYWSMVLEKGSYIVLDQIGKIKYSPEGRRAEFIADMVSRGYEGQILLGTDFARRSDFKSYGGGPGLGYLFSSFIPLLRRVLRSKGFEDRLAETLINENPSKALRIR